MEKMVGSTVLHYEILEKIGQGGMGVVYKAFDKKLLRVVALKFLPADFTSNSSDRERFVREARAASAINHANVCTVHDLNEYEGAQFIVMEYVDGETLKALVKKGVRLPIERIIDYAVQIARALAAAHEKGIIHRDVKSENIMVKADGQIKVMDFGLARTKAAARLSKSASTVGTIAYMSPEQLKGRDFDARADIFSFGVVLYELVTGHLPFNGDYPSAMIYSILHNSPVPASDLRPDVPFFLSDLLQHLLEKSAEKRCQSMSQVIGALEGPDSFDCSPHQKFRRKKHLSRRTTALAVIGLCAFILGSVYALSHPLATLKLQSSNRVIRRLSFTGDAYVPAWSPDGRYIAYGSNGKIYLVPSEGGTSRALENSLTLAAPWSWTPDSRAVLIYGGVNYPLDVIKLGINGEVPQVLADTAVFPSISNAGKILLYNSGQRGFDDAIVAQDLTTGAKRIIAKARGEGTAVYKGFFSPNDKKISYIRWNGHGHELWVMNADGSQDHQVETDPIQVGGHYSWGVDNKSLIIAGKLGYAWSAWKVRIDRKEHLRLMDGAVSARHVSLAPDGVRFCFQQDIDESRIGLVDLETKQMTIPIDLEVGTTHPAFSGDGKEIFFQTIVNGQWQIWKKSLDPGASPHSVIAYEEESCFSPAITSDETIHYVRGKIALEVRHGKMDWQQSLWSARTDGGMSTQIKTAGYRIERIAPTPCRNDHLLYSANNAGGGENIFILPPGPAAEPVLLFSDTPIDYCSAFDWGDENCAFVAHVDTNSQFGSPNAVTAINFNTNVASVVCHLDSMVLDGKKGVPGSIYAMALAPDRQKLAMIITEGARWRLVLYHLLRHSAENIYIFDEKSRPYYIVWSPDNRRIAVELNHIVSDIFVSEPFQFASRRADAKHLD